MPLSLIQTIRSGNEILAKKMVVSGKYGDIDAQMARRDGTALYWAVCLNYYEIAELLLIQGADPNALTNWNSTPLHAASDNNRIELVRLLLQTNCDVNVQTDSGDTPCHLAAYRGYSELVQILVENGASLKKVNNKNRNIYEEAKLTKNIDLINYLQAVYNIACVKTSSPVQGLSLPCSLKDLHLYCPSEMTSEAVWKQYPEINKRKELWLQDMVNGNDLSLNSVHSQDIKLSFRNL